MFGACTARLLVSASLFAASAAAAQPSDYGSLTIAEADRLLQSRNRELQAARRNVEAAQANTVSAGARPNPNLTLGLFSLSPQAGIGAGGLRDKTVDSSVRIDQVIERGNKRELRIAAARNLESASSEDLDDVLRQQRLALRLAYYDLLFAQDKAVILLENARSYERTLAAAELRLKAGDIAASDVARIRVDVLRAENDARAAEADRLGGQVALAYLVGAEAQAAEIRAVDAWPATAAITSDAISDGIIDRRPDVRAAKKRVDAAQGARELARSLQTRDVSVGMQYDHYPVNPSYAAGSGAGVGNSYGAFVSVPLFTRYYYEGEIRRAEVDYSAALDALEKVRAQARAELSRALSGLQSAADRVRRYDESLLGEARKSADAAEFAYKNGAIGVMDLLDASRTLRATQLDAAGSRNDYAKALAAWRAGTGDMLLSGMDQRSTPAGGRSP